MEYRIFDEETGETLSNDFPTVYYDSIRQLAHDLTESQGGYDEDSLIVVMEIDPANPPTGWDEFVSDMMGLAEK